MPMVSGVIAAGVQLAPSCGNSTRFTPLPRSSARICRVNVPVPVGL
jgi:hypothetical protein